MRVIDLLYLFCYAHFANGLIVLKVNHLDKPAYEEYVGEPWATVKVGKNLKTETTSFCFRFQINGAFSKQTGFSALDPNYDFGTWLSLTDNYGFVILNSKALIFSIPEDYVRPYSWFNFCFSRNMTHYKVASNGELWFENKIRNDMVDGDMFLNELVVVGNGLKGE